MHSKRKRGQLVGDFELLEPLGRGGNGEVWSIKQDVFPDDSLVLKILHKRLFKSGQRYSRFQTEAEQQKKLSDGHEAGVLPVMDYYMPPQPTQFNPPWILLPQAKTVSSHEVKPKDLTELVFAIKRIAEVLFRLSKTGISHRDIKPDNLFHYNGEWVLGDFGLVCGPEISSITLSDEVVGPGAFIAPEMKVAPIDSDGNLADVYSLAKTFWYLSSGYNNLNKITGGQLGTGLPQYTISHFHPGLPGVKILDLLVRKATEQNPKDRITIQEFVEILTNWLKPKSHKEFIQPVDFQKMKKTLGELTAPLKLQNNVAQKQAIKALESKNAISRISDQVQLSIEDIWLELAKAEIPNLNVNGSPDGRKKLQYRPSPDPYVIEQNRFAGLPDSAASASSKLAGFSIRLQTSGKLLLAGWVVIRLLPDNVAFTKAAYTIHHNEQRQVIWSSNYNFIELDNEEHVEEVVESIRSDLAQHINSSMSMFIQYCGDVVSS